MTLNNKILILISSLWILFIFLTAIEFSYFLSHAAHVNSTTLNSSLILFICTGLFFLLFTLLLFHILLHKEQQTTINSQVEKIKNQALLTNYDILTSLPTYAVFNEILNKAIYNANRYNKILAILIIDIDNFKKLNASLGYSMSDQILKEIGARFAYMVKGSDLLARINGDEFIILLNDINHHEFAGIIANKLLNACARPIKINEKTEITVTASVGISVFPNDGTSLEILQDHADVAMRKAKRMGGNIFQYHMNERYASR